MDRCIVHRDGEILRHRTLPAGPAPFLKALTPSREDLVVWGAGLCTWSWLADLWAREAMPCVRGHALSRQAIHGGTAHHDQMDAQKSAVRRRGGMLPQAYVSPADLRATRDLLRRRMPGLRQRAARLAHVHHTTSPYHLPEIGTKRASKAHRDGVAERCPEPAVPQSSAGDLALLGHDDQRLRDVAVSRLKAATQDDANTRSVLRPVPGIGAILRRVRL
jgi:hypothetical protein